MTSQDKHRSGSGLPIKPGDYSIIINDRETEFNSKATCYDSNGEEIWKITCLAKGQTPDYTKNCGDTPPGVYTVGNLTVTQVSEPKSTWYAYGKYFFDLESYSNAEEKYNRAGCGIHGGGSNAPDPLAPYQQLCPTNGCIRFYNKDLEEKILPLWEKTKESGNTIYVTVNQF